MNQWRRLTLRTAGGAALTLAGLAVLLVVALIGESVMLFVGQGNGLICPDGGDEIWSRPGVGAHIPMILVGIGAILLGRFMLLRLFRRFGIVRPSISSWLLAALSVGSISVYVAVDDYLTYWNYPDRYRCGYSYPAEHVPGVVEPVLVGAFVIAFLAVFVATIVSSHHQLSGAS
jgi:hypothetical protein